MVTPINLFLFSFSLTISFSRFSCFSYDCGNKFCTNLWCLFGEYLSSIQFLFSEFFSFCLAIVNCTFLFFSGKFLTLILLKCWFVANREVWAVLFCISLVSYCSFGCFRFG